ncbi:MAG: hypothetical protein Q8O94_02820 [bacterium]|nr:hypothetical protein [bacterium]
MTEVQKLLNDLAQKIDLVHTESALLAAEIEGATVQAVGDFAAGYITAADVIEIVENYQDSLASKAATEYVKLSKKGQETVREIVVSVLTVFGAMI